jgi:two-component system, OmpR family, phosphate regulon sensor histidine kinase PhoR
MFKGLSFRKKIILSQLVLFAIFFSLLFPLVEKMSYILVRDSLIESTSDLIQRIEHSKTENEMIQALKEQQYFSFFRISLINANGFVIFDTHMERLLGDSFQSYPYTEHSEIQEALKKGVGYAISPSGTFRGTYAYVAETFTFNGKTYILRTAFPYEQIQDLTGTFEIGVLIYSFVILLFFNALIWLIFNRFTRPIREVIKAITPYQKGEQSQLPEIQLTMATSPTDEFQRLANAFNSLSGKIQQQINAIKEEKDEKEAILESLGEGVIAVNEKMEVLYINFIACKMLGIHRREILGKPLNRGAQGKRELTLKCVALLKRCQEQVVILIDSLTLGGEKKTYIDLIAAPKAHATGAIIVLQDKTHHYRVLEMGKDFVANASHELRTPITIIKGYAETLHDVTKLTREQTREITEKIGRSCERMENLVKKLLTLADIENIPESRFQECDLKLLLGNCQHALHSVYPAAQVEIHMTDQQVLIKADSGLLELAISNLLENAVKYSEPPAQLDIFVEPFEEEVKIQIRDQGRGIPPEDVEHIFERFYRVDKTHSRRLGGAGLGLSIVKTIIHKHDGTIEVSSELGKGTTFTILLPKRHHGRL